MRGIYDEERDRIVFRQLALEETGQGDRILQLGETEDWLTEDDMHPERVVAKRPRRRLYRYPL